MPASDGDEEDEHDGRDGVAVAASSENASNSDIAINTRRQSNARPEEDNIQNGMENDDGIGYSARKTEGRGDDIHVDEEDESEDGDEEPTLRYTRLTSKSITEVFARDSCSAIAVSSQFLALGTHNGGVIVLARPGSPILANDTIDKLKGKHKGERDTDTQLLLEEGNTVIKKYKPHSASIMDIVIDEDSQFIGTASIDGKVVILQLATSDAQEFNLKRPLRCLALEPSYAIKSTRQLVSGGMAGNLVLHEKGWLGPKDITLHSGDGPIWVVKWRRNHIAWASDRGIRIYDSHTSQRIAFIPREDDSPRADLFPCNLLWQSDACLVIAWADFIKIVTFRDRAEKPKKEVNSELTPNKVTSSLASLGGMAAFVPGIGSPNGSQQGTYAEVTNVLQLDCMISGIMPLLSSDPIAPSGPIASTYSTTPNFIVLSHSTQSMLGEQVEADSVQHLRKPSQPLELRIISVSSGEEMSSDVLHVSDYERWECKDYRIVGYLPAINETSSKPSRRHQNHDSYFVISPKDVVHVKKRDVEDHIAWLCERLRYEEALNVAERQHLIGIIPSAKSAFSVAEIGRMFLDHLVEQGQYDKAAQSCAKIFGTNIKAWEDWIFTFVQKGQIQTVIPYIPTHEPQLSAMVYEMILAHFLRNDAAVLLQTIKTWPHHIYDIAAVINAIRGTLDRDKLSPSADMLMQCLVELHLAYRQPGKAIPYFLRLRKAGVFDLIREYNLFPDIQDQALLLVDFDQDIKRRKERERKGLSEGKAQTNPRAGKHGEAIELLVDHTHSIPTSRVVKQLQPNRFYLYMYLDALFSKDAQLAFEYSDLLIDLYAEYDYDHLLEFLRKCSDYDLEKAYDISKAKDYVPEMVFLLGRMGNNKQALMLIIERLGDVQRAIEFAQEQNDHDLWDDLLTYAESKPTFIRGLLEKVGLQVDPIRLIRRIKNGLEIPGLKPALIKILQDFNIQISLIEGCETILRSDCRVLITQLNDGQSNAFFGSTEFTACYKCEKPVFSRPVPSSSTTASATAAEAVSIIFLCHHAWHISCAFPDIDLPSRPQHFLNPLLDKSQITTESLNNPYKDKDITAKVIFASQLRARAVSKVNCPACSSKRGSL